MRTWPALDVGENADRDVLHAALLDHHVTAIDESSAAPAWRVFFATEADRGRAAAELARRYPALAIRALDVPDEDWAARSQAALRAVRVGRIVVAPPWDVPAGGARADQAPEPRRPGPFGPGDDQGGAESSCLVIIRPSTGFGTGHHATTRLCLDALQQIDLRGRRVLDVGTGSGVLAIAARMLGAAHVVALEADPDALEAARENVALNGCPDILLEQVDARTMPPALFDVVTANLTGALLWDLAPQITAALPSGGHVVLAGVLAGEAPDVLDAYAALVVLARAEEDEWVCLTLQRP